jgi:hypothetical protein
MKKLLAFLLLVPAFAMGAGNDLLLNQRNPADTITQLRGVSPPDGGGTNAVLGYAGSTNLPVFYRIGAGLSISSGVLDTVPSGAPAWTSITGKPVFATVATTGAYADLLGVPTAFIPTAHTHAAADITSGTLAVARIPALSISQTTGLQAAIDAKYSTPTGTTAQYIRGDGTLATLPVAKRIETYSGTTNASGQIVVTYGTAYPAVPVVQPPAPAAANQVWTTVASTTTGFTLQLNQRNTVTLLSVEVLLGATVPVSGAAATVLVVAQ